VKARKTMKNPALIQEVISQISQQFTTKIPEIKKAIETLLEKEYIKRVDGSKDTFANVVSRPTWLYIMLSVIQTHRYARTPIPFPCVANLLTYIPTCTAVPHTHTYIAKNSRERERK
jgi:hypothetical protein